MSLNTLPDDAVSPVVGVILMLVVTIVIAAVITAFATGTADGTTQAPMVMLDIQNPSGSQFEIVHKGGDVLVLENIEIVVDSVGGADTGILNFYRYNTEKSDGSKYMTVVGKPSNADTLISAGDVIQLELIYSYGVFPPNTLIKWKINDVRTSSILAQGEYVVQEES